MDFLRFSLAVQRRSSIAGVESEYAASMRALKETHSDTLLNRLNVYVLTTWKKIAMQPFSPIAGWRQTWNTALKLVVVYIAINLPLQLSELTEQSTPLVIFDTFCDFFFLFDVFLNLRTAYVDSRGELVTDLKVIRATYMRSWFAVDLISAIPADLIMGIVGLGNSAESQLSTLLKVLKLPRMFRVHRLVGSIKYFTIMKMLNVLGVLFLSVHWFACAWNFVGREDEYSCVNVWIEERDQMSRYLVLLHRTWIMLLKNDVQPVTNADAIMCEVGIVGGILLEATIFASLVLYVQKIGAKASDFVSKVEVVKQNMKDLRVPNHVQDKVLNYYDYMWTRYSGNTKSDAWMGELSTSLRKEINEHLHLDFLSRIPLFRTCGADVLRDICQVLIPRIYQPADYVARFGEWGEELFFVQSGMLVLYLTSGYDRLSASQLLRSQDEGAIEKVDHEQVERVKHVYKRRSVIDSMGQQMIDSAAMSTLSFQRRGSAPVVPSKSTTTTTSTTATTSQSVEVRSSPEGTRNASTTSASARYDIRSYLGLHGSPFSGKNASKPNASDADMSPQNKSSIITNRDNPTPASDVEPARPSRNAAATVADANSTSSSASSSSPPKKRSARASIISVLGGQGELTDNAVKRAEKADQAMQDLVQRLEAERVNGVHASKSRTRLLGNGSFFGEVSVLLRERRVATVQSLTYSDIYVLTSADFHRVMRHYPSKLFVMRWVAIRRKQATESMSAATDILAEETSDANISSHPETPSTDGADATSGPLSNIAGSGPNARRSSMDAMYAMDGHGEAFDNMVQLAGELCRLLGLSSIFAECSKDFVETVAASMERVEWEPGQVIMRRGEKNENLYLILEGEAVILDHRGYIFTTLGAGSSIGELSLFTQAPVSKTVKAAPRPRQGSKSDKAGIYVPLTTYKLHRDRMADLAPSFPEDHLLLTNFAAKQKEDFAKMDRLARTLSVFKPSPVSEKGDHSEAANHQEKNAVGTSEEEQKDAGEDERDDDEYKSYLTSKYTSIWLRRGKSNTIRDPTRTAKLPSSAMPGKGGGSNEIMDETSIEAATAELRIAEELKEAADALQEAPDAIQEAADAVMMSTSSSVGPLERGERRTSREAFDNAGQPPATLAPPAIPGTPL